MTKFIFPPPRSNKTERFLEGFFWLVVLGFLVSISAILFWK